MSEDPDSSWITIDVDLRDPAWTVSQPAAAQTACAAARAALAAAPEVASLPRPLELSLVLADDAFACALNRAYRGQDKPTNVLSFASLEGDLQAPAPEGAPLPLGDIVLARETLEREAAAAGKSLDAHLSHLVVHGVLHLLGYEHEEERDAERMESLEVEILQSLGIADPYASAGGADAQAARAAER